jgi:glucosamine kinase
MFLGVEGGGTRTRARVRDAGGRNLGEGEDGPGNARLGDPAWDAVMRASLAALAAAGIRESSFASVHAGMGLAGTQQHADRAAILKRSHPFGSLAVDTDAYAAHLGAFGGADGAILILGTGSCGLAVIKGRRVTVGGWGAEIADEGSGFAMGRLAVRRAIMALEGMGPLTPLVEEILAAFDRDPEKAVAWATRAVPAHYARFAPTVFTFAGRGDAQALPIVAEAATGAAMMIDRLIALVSGPNPSLEPISGAGAPRIAMVGGIFPPMLPWLPERLRPFLVVPAADARDGAILMAKQNAGSDAGRG